MKIDHIGYAVKRIDRAKDAFEKLGFTFEPTIDDTDRNVRLAFGMKDGYKIELVSPLDRKQESPVDQYLARGAGIPYHFCYECDDLEQEIKNLENNGFKVVVEPASAIAFNGKRVVFMMSLGFGLMEIVESY